MIIGIDPKKFCLDFEKWFEKRVREEAKEDCEAIFGKGVVEDAFEPLSYAEWFYGQVGRHKENSHEQD